MSQSVDQQVAHQIDQSTTAGLSLRAGPQGAELHTKPQNMCTLQYTKKNDHMAREAIDKANSNGSHICLTTSAAEILYAMWEHEVAALKPQSERREQAMCQTRLANILSSSIVKRAFQCPAEPSSHTLSTGLLAKIRGNIGPKRRGES